MTETIDPHPDVLEPVTSELPAVVEPEPEPDPVSRCRCPSPVPNYRVATCGRCGKPLPKTEADREAQAADAARAVDVAINLTKVGEALTRWAQVAADRAMTGLALMDQGWSVVAKARLRATDKAAVMRLDLRLVATHLPTGPLGTEAIPRDIAKPLTEEHHSLMDLSDLPADASMVAGLFQAALGELVDITAAPMRRRLQHAGVLELPPSAIGCAGALCVGCGNPLCPRTIERRQV